MVITAEPYPLVSAPSSLVMFASEPAKEKKAVNESFTFSEFADAPAKDYPSIAAVEWRKDRNLDLEQARKACELAEQVGARDYATGLMGEASVALAQATALATKSTKTKATIEYSRRAVDTCAEAIRVTERRKESEALAAQVAERKAEMAALEQRAAEAEAAAEAAAQSRAAAEAKQAEALAQQATAEAAVLTAQARMTDMQRETAELEQQKQRLEAEKIALEQEKVALEQQKAGLEQDKAALASRLQGALSKVAETTEGARGMIVNLPDILFNTNEADLKADAKIVIAKLAGILLIMPELNLRVEGHTDSTGSTDWNQTLSQKRAQSVVDFLIGQGIDGSRMIAQGYGSTRAVGDNSTAEGRRKNRRVDIVIAEGEVAEAE